LGKRPVGGFCGIVSLVAAIWISANNPLTVLLWLPTCKNNSDAIGPEVTLIVNPPDDPENVVALAVVDPMVTVTLFPVKPVKL
jgi:hypothetical protein